MQANRQPWRRVAVLGVYLLCAMGFGISDLAAQPLAQHYDVAKFLAGIAATLFAILGVWIAVLGPKGLLNAGNGTQNPTADHQLIIKLLQPWLYATVTFALSVLTAFCLGILQGLECSAKWLQQAAGAVNVLMFLLIVDSLVGTLLPIAHIRSAIQKQHLIQGNRQL